MRKSQSLPDVTSSESDKIDSPFFLSGSGDCAVSIALRDKIEQNQDIERKFTAHFKIDNRTVIEGSFRKDNGRCPDILFEDFKLGTRVSPNDPNQTFLQRCQSLQGNEIDKINAVLDLVIQIIIQPTLDCQGKTFYGCDYEHPNWQCQTTKDYRVEGRYMPIGEFARLGFGDCRIVNGLVSFGLNHCGLDANYSYKKIFSQTLDQSDNIISTKSTDHAVCIVTINDNRYVADAFIFRCNGHLVEKLVTQHIKAGDPKDLPIGTSDLYKWREKISVHSEIIDPTDRTQTRQMKQTNPFPTSTITQPAIRPYTDATNKIQSCYLIT